MAIKFEDRKQAATAAASIEARFATPIEAVAPVDSDSTSELAFEEQPKAEKAGRRRKQIASGKGTSS